MLKIYLCLGLTPLIASPMSFYKKESQVAKAALRPLSCMFSPYFKALGSNTLNIDIGPDHITLQVNPEEVEESSTETGKPYYTYSTALQEPVSSSAKLILKQTLMWGANYLTHYALNYKTDTIPTPLKTQLAELHTHLQHATETTKKQYVCKNAQQKIDESMAKIRASLSISAINKAVETALINKTMPAIEQLYLFKQFDQKIEQLKTANTSHYSLMRWIAPCVAYFNLAASLRSFVEQAKEVLHDAREIHNLITLPDPVQEPEEITPIDIKTAISELNNKSEDTVASQEVRQEIQSPLHHAIRLMWLSKKICTPIENVYTLSSIFIK